MRVPTVNLFAKFPVPGKAKTRLIPALGPEGAAALHRRLTERTLARVRASGLPFAVRYTGASAGDFAAWLGGDVPLTEQGEGDLGERLARVEAPAILLGADIPDLSERHLAEAARALRDHDTVIGPAADGGYYLLGFTTECPALFTGIAWGTKTVRKGTMKAISGAGLSCAVLQTLHDCDRPEDLARWPDLTA
ncbi:TIGR04282 family arsenosugar biosynthesis glycosyltransferase [Aurantiacibacter spongiae]|uniref:Glycosyltransferase n=1 Tax=Aurantiacibacter spongiae TaxID=2488860 RepID=A0A3N5CWF8_9SPHN|nr:TIGR04282 family arsenosugar biosynthesis glycosyltransferase [Aurantiacibacter spongiae]RPF71880.1 glycosyltransferase [Aurantiacibacter spongiae]